MSACVFERAFYKSTMLECYDEWTLAVENCTNVDVCYIDLSIAFDSVSILKLIYKLLQYGLRDDLLN